MHSISKTITFESAHRLVHGYPDKCRFVHGHSYRATIYMRSESLNGYGMVRDFADVKVLKDWIDKNLDHGTLVSKVDQPLIDWLKANEQRHFIMPSENADHPNPTSENISKFLYKKAHELGLKETYAVEVDETCTSKARYEP